MKTPSLITAIVAFAVLPGCASITGQKTQAISVQTHTRGTQVVDAKCVLINDKGTWFLSTPGSIMVQKSYGDMSVKCEKTDMSPGMAYYQSKSNGGVWGNLLLGGVVGYAIDAGSGSGFDYPTLMTVEMGIIQAAPPKREEPKPAGSQVMGSH